MSKKEKINLGSSEYYMASLPTEPLGQCSEFSVIFQFISYFENNELTIFKHPQKHIW